MRFLLKGHEHFLHSSFRKNMSDSWIGEVCYEALSSKMLDLQSQTVNSMPMQRLATVGSPRNLSRNRNKEYHQSSRAENCIDNKYCLVGAGPHGHIISRESPETEVQRHILAAFFFHHSIFP